MAKAHKSWAEKLNNGTTHEVKPVPMNIAGMKKGEIMLVPTARLVDDFIRAIPKGKAMDYRELRKRLAKKFGAEVTCPITTGFHLKTVAEAAYEALEQGVPLSKITPVWRVLDEKAPTINKLSFDPAFLFDQRQHEGL